MTNQVINFTFESALAEERSSFVRQLAALDFVVNRNVVFEFDDGNV